MDTDTETNEYMQLFTLVHLVQVLEKLDLVSDKDAAECKVSILSNLFQLMEGANGGY